MLRDDRPYSSGGSPAVPSSASKYLPASLGALGAASLLAAVVGSAKGGRAGLIFGTIAAAGGALSLFGCGGGEKGKTKQWEKSESAVQSDEVERYANEGNADKLDEIGNTARSRGTAMAEKIRQARQSGSKTVNHEGREIPIKEAEALVVFDRLVAVRADLNENRLSKNVQSRIGGELPETWQQRLQEEGGKAQQSQFDGYLLLLLDQLDGEVSKDQATAERLAGEIASFEKQAPKVQLDKATGDLQGFRTGEVGREQSLHGQYASLVRNRTHQRLYSANTDYRTQHDRSNKLSVLNSTLVNPAVDAAVYIDTQLAEMIQNRRQEFILLAEARRHERVLTTCYRDEPYHVPDPIPGGDEDSEGGIKRGGGRPSGGDEDSEGGIKRGGGATPRGGDEDSEGGIRRGGGSPSTGGDEDSEGGIRRGGGTSRGGDEDSEGGILRQGMLGSGLAEIRYKRVPYQCYEDQSGSYKTQAAIVAERAKNAARNAQARLETLQPLIGRMYGDPVIKAEGLDHLLP
ncbi:MAG: hypothetical protein HY539_00560, partial [Deltaproteobacteria bacterium]|nr:hypothetical protein [Deltaproteobacteria bacterium]